MVSVATISPFAVSPLAFLVGLMGLEALLPLGRFLPSTSSTLLGDFELEAAGVRRSSSDMTAGRAAMYWGGKYLGSDR